jgi:plasmid stabilization system protein ParE
MRSSTIFAANLVGQPENETHSRRLTQAKADLRNALHYLAGFAPVAAQRWADGFEDAIASLATNPERWGLAPESGLMGLEIRQLIYRAKSGSASRALFVVADDEVRVLRIRRPGEKLLSEDDLL